MEGIFKLSVMVNLLDRLSRPTRDMGLSLTDFIKKIKNTKLTLKDFNDFFKTLIKSGAKFATTGFLIAKGVLSPVSATFETQKALGELSSVGITDLKALEKAGKDFSNTFAGTTKSEFISSAYDIKSGIASLSDEGVAKFTELAGLTAKATKASIEEMTSLFAVGYGIYKDFYSSLSDAEFGEMFSAGISKSVQQFKTTGSEMAQAISRLGGSATSANVPLEEQLAILGMLQATMTGAEAGTKYTAFLKSASTAGKNLGLSFVDANNQLLALPQILSIIKGKYGETLDAIEKSKLQTAFGTEEAVKLIDLLYNKTGDLENNIVTLYDSMGQGTNVAKGMANAINGTDGDKFLILKQRIKNIVEEIGTNMLPVINKWLDKGGDLLEHISTFIEKNGELVGKIFLGIAVFGAFLTVVGVLKMLFGGLGLLFTTSVKGLGIFKLGLKALFPNFDTVRLYGMYAGDAIKSFGKNAWVTATTQIPKLIASCWSFTTALLANPVTWIVLGIVALVAVIILLWKNWDKVSTWLSDTWNSVVTKVIDGWNWLKGKLEETPNWLLGVISAFMPFIGIPLLIIKNWESISGFFSNLWINIKTGFNTFFNEFLPNLWESGKNIMKAIGDGIKSAVMYPFQKAKEGFSKLRELLPFSDAKEGPLSNLTLSGSRINTTIAEGMNKTKNAPMEMINKTLSSVNNVINFDEFKEKLSIRPEEVDGKTGLLSKIVATKSEISEVSSTKKDGNTTVINLNVDMKNLKDLKTLMRFVKEIEEDANKDDDDNVDKRVV